MKKLAIAGASVALAAMPVVGVFAETVTDNVTLTITASCSLSSDPSGGHSTSNKVNLGESTVTPSGHAFEGATTGANTGTTMTIGCNTNSGWQVEAQATALTNTTKSENSKSFAFQGYTGTGTAHWSAQLAPGGNDQANAAITTAWQTFAGEKSGSSTVVAQDVNGQAVYGYTITPTYKAWAPANQEAGTYDGYITYTFGAKS